MKRYTVDGTGLNGLRLEEYFEPQSLGPRDALIDVRAVSLNYRDLMVCDGRYGGKQDPPIVACSDMAGVVVGVGSDVVEFKEGDRVLNAPFCHWPAGTLRPDWARTFVGGNGVDGVLAERIVYPADALVSLPEHFTFREGSTLTIAGLTAWSAVVTHGRARPGDWVLVHGTGGVSVFGVQLARLLGARTILSTASDAKAKIAKHDLKVDEVIDYRDEDWPKQVREITRGHGVDVVVEVAGGASLGRSIQASAYGGRVSLVGVLDGVESILNVRDMLFHQVTVIGILMESTEELRALTRACDRDKLHPYISKVFPFDRVCEAYEFLRSQKHVGKVVIDVT